jgi:hypothetical protein
MISAPYISVTKQLAKQAGTVSSARVQVVISLYRPLNFILFNKGQENNTK